MKHTFELDESQEEILQEWLSEHDCDADAGSIGGRLSYVFTPTGLGDLVEVRCLCGGKISLTNSDNW